MNYSVPKKMLSAFLAFVMVLTAVAVGIIPLDPVTQFKVNAAYTELTAFPTNATALNGYYKLTSNKTISASGTTASGWSVAANATALIYIAEGVTLTVTGGKASGTTGGKAGILMNTGSVLIITGPGNLKVTGGNGANGSNGSKGEDASTADSGKGGAGGAGGGGGGAGIGGNGGDGGSGASETSSSDVNGNSGSSGSNGGAGGTVYVLTYGTNTLTAGSGGSGGSGGSAGGNSSFMITWYGGGGGAGGGGGYGGSAIGGGGAGAGGGGGGAGGRYSQDKGSPGLGGKGSSNGSNGSGGSWKTSGSGGSAGTNGTGSLGYTAPEAAKITVSLNKVGGTGGSNDVKCTIGYPMTTITPPTKVGYTFEGYYTAESGGTKYYNADGSSAHILDYRALDLYAHWTLNKHYIDINSYIYSVSKDTGTDDGGLGNKATANVTVGGTLVGNAVNDYYGQHDYNSSYSISVEPIAGWKLDGVREPLSGYTIGVNTDSSIVVSGNIPDNNLSFRFNLRPKVIKLTLDDQNADSGKTGTATVYYKYQQNSTQDTSNTSYTGTYFTNGDNSNNTVTGVITAITKPEKIGYTFDGYWDAAIGGTQYIDTNGNFIETYGQTAYNTFTEDNTLYAHWTLTSYTITYNTNGGDPITAKTYTTTDNTYRLPTPERKGYNFVRWDASNNTGNWDQPSYKADDPVSGKYGDVTLTAVWEPRTFTVTLDKDGGEGGDSVVHPTFDADMPEISIPSKLGYDFDGYYAEEDGKGTKYYDEFGRSANKWDRTSLTKLYAKWIPDEYTIIYNGNQPEGASGSVADLPGSHTETYGEEVTIANAPTLAGWTFEGWNTTPDGKGDWYYAGDKVADNKLYPGTNSGSVTLYAQWTPKTYTVHFDGNGFTGGLMHDQTFTYDTPGRLSANGYSRRYTVTYHEIYNGVDTLHTTYAIYTFAGWATEEDGAVKYTNGQTDVKNITSEDEITLYAVWEGGTVTLANYPHTGTAIEAWYSDSSLSDSSYAGKPGETYKPGKNVDLYAKWVENEYDIIYAANGAEGTAPDSQTGIKYDEHVTLKDSGTLSKTGYEFAGWNTEENGSGTQYNAGDKVQGLTMDSSITLYAQWTPKTYTVTFHSNDGTGSSAAASATYDAAWPAAPSIARAGLTFEGWYSENGEVKYYNADGTPVNSAYTIDGDTEVYAKWTTVKYSIKYVSGVAGDTNVSDMPETNPAEKEYGVNLTLASAPKRTGYVFAGWATVDGKIIYAAGADFNADPENVTDETVITLTATWEAVKYTVEYDGNVPSGADSSTLSNVPAAQTKTYGAALKLSETTPSLAGYEFLGWEIYVGENRIGTGMLNAGAVLNTDYVNAQGEKVTLKAHWTEVGYKVIYNANGGEPETQEFDVSYGVTYPIPEAVTRTGYEFIGWFTSTGVEIHPGDDVYNPPAGTVLFARWEINKSTVKVDPNGGNWDGETEKTYTDGYDSYIDIPVPTREGYTFTGWVLKGEGDSEPNGKLYDNTYVFGAEKNKTDILTAQWDQIKFDITLILGAGYEVVEQSASSVEYNGSYTVKIKLSEGYTKSGAPSATVNSLPLGAVDNGDGTYTYTVTEIKENKTVKIEDAQKNTYNITVTDDGAKGIAGYAPQNSVSVEHGTGTTTITVTLDDAYSNSDAPVITYNASKASLSGGVKKVVNGKTVYTYTVYNVTDDCEFIIGSATANSYIVTLSGTMVGYTVTEYPASSVEYGKSVSFTIELEDAYSKSGAPECSVKIGENDVESSDIKVSVNGRFITYTVENITDNTQIFIGDAVINEYSVTLVSSDVGYSVTTYPAAVVSHGDSVTVKIMLNEAYSNSPAPAISLDPASAGSALRHKNGNEVTYTVTNIKDDIKITIGDAAKNRYTVTFYPGAGVDMFDMDKNEITEGKQFAVYYGDSFSFTLGNTGSFIPKVFANGVAVEPNANGVYTVNVTRNIIITTEDVKYTVIFVDWDNSILASFIVSAHDNAPTDKFSKPKRESSDYHHYEFSGWLCTSPKGSYEVGDMLEDVTENRVFQAQYITEHHDLPLDSSKDGHWHYCPECGYKEDVASHTPGSLKIENRVPSTCTTRGSHDEVLYCTVCKYEIKRENVTDELDFNNHSTDKTYSEILYNANCKEAGRKVYYCLACKHVVAYEEIPVNADAHNWGAWVANGDNMSHSRTCVRCDMEQTKYHSLREIFRSGATCVTNGSTVSFCPDCTTVVTEAPPATEKHIAGDPVWENYKAPTCVQRGRYDLVRHCTMCGLIMDEYTQHIDVPATGIHSYELKFYTVDGAIIDYDRFECGFKVSAYYECTYCGHPYTEEFTVEHQYEWEMTTPPTDKASGTATGVCSKCGDTITAELPFEPTGERFIQFIEQKGVSYVIPYEQDKETGAWTANSSNPTKVSGRIGFYTNVDLKFFVYISNAFGYNDYDVYIDGVKAVQNPDGSYSVKASAENASISVVGTTPSVIDPGDSGTDNGGNNAKLSIWQRIVNFFKSIGDFFRNLFS